MQVAIHTLGCKVNQYETAALERELLARGHSLVPFDGPADAYIINTCTVTALSDKKSRQTIRRARRRGPEAVVAVCGCFSQTNPKAVEELGVDLIAGTAGRMRFLDDLEELCGGRQGRQGDGSSVFSCEIDTAFPYSKKTHEPSPCLPRVTVDDIFQRRAFEPLTAGGLEGRTRAMLKVQDGCASFCAYCIIPFARGPVRSLPLDRAVEAAGRLAAEGCRELVLTGIELSSWGQDLGSGSGPIDLIEGVCAAAPGCRVRLGSLEPRTVTGDFCRRAAALDNLCPHFHLSLQSGCDATLRRMNRKYNTARFLESVQLLRAHFDRPGVTTDLIVGFPGETEGEFDQTLSFLRTCAFSAMHIFPYSRRAGTRAADMPGQVPRAVREARAHAAARAAAELEGAWLDSWAGERLSVLFEEEKEGLWRGHAPNYTEVRAAGTDLHNQVRGVRITGRTDAALLGELD